MSKVGAIHADVEPYLAVARRAAIVLARMSRTPTWRLIEAELRNHPRPLPIDGHAYRRRTLNRRKR